jgi:hypothetical protein
VPLTRQLSLFGVEANDPTPADLAGLLAGPGELSRLGGTARVAVRVDAAWRVHAITAELAARGLPATWRAAAAATEAGPAAAEAGPAATDAAPAPAWFVVRTAYTALLTPLAAAWWEAERGIKRPPAGFHLSGPALRLWVAAAGGPTPDGYLLRLGADDAASWPAVGAALHAVGLAAALLMPPAGGPRLPPDKRGTAGDGAGTSANAAPAYRITGKRRLARLAELVGDPPPVAPAHAWPAAA